jgi:hypothetical protein
MIWILIPVDQDRVFALFALAVVFFELGVHRLPWTLRVSAYVTAAVAVFMPMFENHPFWVIFSQHDNHLFLVQLGCASSAAALLFRARSIESSLLSGEQRRVVHAFSLLTLLCCAFALLDRTDPFAALGWALLAAAWWHLGAFLKDPRFQIHANLLLAVVFLRLMFWNLPDHGFVGGMSIPALTLIPVALIRYYLWWRSAATSDVPSGKGLAALHLWAAAILLFSEIGVDVIEPWRPAAWMVLALVLVAAGQLSGIAIFRLQGLLAALPVLVFGLAQAFSGGAVLPVSIAIALLFAAQFFLPRNSNAARTTPLSLAERDGRLLMSIVGTVLLTALLYHQFPGGWLTTAWGIEGLALLILGFPLRERVFRMEGLALLLFCILKLFLYDLRNLETFFRILSFIALGVILLGVSLLYTRFGERIRRYL